MKNTIAVSQLAVCLATALGLSWATSAIALDRSMQQPDLRNSKPERDVLLHAPIDFSAFSSPPTAANGAATTRASKRVATAQTRVVTNCNDAGPGSLRATVASAGDGDTVDLSQLVCSTITLTTGTITVAAQQLTLHGPGESALTITAPETPATPRIFKDYADIDIYTAFLHLDNLTISNAGGGCIYSKPSLQLDHVTITNCRATNGSVVTGAAVNSDFDVFANYSTISNNVLGSSSGNVAGAGIYAFNVFLNHSTVANNTAQTKYNVYGAGIFSQYSARIEASTVTGNEATSINNNAFGGGIFAHAEVKIQSNSSVTQNQATAKVRAYGGGVFTDMALKVYASSLSFNDAYGFSAPAVAGGAFARRGMIFRSSTISGNTAKSSDPSIYSNSGATYVPVSGGSYHYRAYFHDSTISGNSASHNVGAIRGEIVTLDQCTVSGNSAGYFIGGIYTTIQLNANNSTIAFNHASVDVAAGKPVAAGIQAVGSGAVLVSTIVANNVAGSNGSDFSATSMAGDHNLIRASLTVVVPGTLGADPLLQPLANNGGPTETHALAGASPARDQGANPSNHAYDQRGSGYARLHDAAVDIGAFELPSDHIFQNGFE